MTRNGTQRLSELARHVKIPSDIASTSFPRVEKRAFEMGLPFDEWQKGAGRLALAKREDGMYAAGIGGVVMSIPRQVGKTYFVSALVFALCTLLANQTVIWTAHRTRTHNETFKKMQSLTTKKLIAPYIRKVRTVNGEQEIEFYNGSRIMFGARESGFGRGFDKVDILVLDEAQILSEDAMTDMVPATIAAPNGLVFMMGTPPRPRDPGDVFRETRARALAGDKDTAYIEFSADIDANPDDRKQLAKANPSYPHRTSETAVLRMQKLLGSGESFRREALGIWDETAGKPRAIRRELWSDLVAEKRPPKAVPSYGVRFSADGSGVALGAAWRAAKGPVHVEPIKQASLSEGIAWLVDELVELAPDAAQIVIDGRAGVGPLVDALKSRGVRNKKLIIVPTVPQVIEAHAMFEQAVIGRTVTHSGNGAFDDQVLSAYKRKIGNAGGFGWEPPEGSTVVSFDAVTLAHWAAKTTTRKVDRKGVRV